MLLRCCWMDEGNVPCYQIARWQIVVAKKEGVDSCQEHVGDLIERMLPDIPEDGGGFLVFPIQRD